MIGTDIIEISRIEKALTNPLFLTRVFTENELRYYADKGGRAETLAGMFCAKEAVAKALKTGFTGFDLQDIEILHDGACCPYAVLHKGAARLTDKAPCISISHCREYAVAVCILT